MNTTPDNGNNNDTGYETTSPRLDYRVNFNRTGIHYVWIRSHRLSAFSDSVHVGLNGAAVSTADRISSFVQDAWAWSNTTMDSGAFATIDVPSVGIHTVNVWMREDGTPFDKMVLTSDFGFVPTDSGPAESPRQ